MKAYLFDKRGVLLPLRWEVVFPPPPRLSTGELSGTKGAEWSAVSDHLKLVAVGDEYAVYVDSAGQQRAVEHATRVARRLELRVE